MNWEIIIWFGIMLAFLVVEAACPLHLVSIWFAAGSLVAMIAAALHAEIWLQIVLFLVVSATLLAALWPFTRKMLNPKLAKTNVDAVVGATGKVIEPIDNIQSIGRVKIGGMEWSARSTTGEAIPAGSEVKIDRVEGVKVYVTPVTVAVK